MDLKETIQKRHSVRSYSDKKVPKKIINEIIEYAHLAPSAGNLQAREFIIVDDDGVKKKLSAAALNQKFIIEAPINIVVCANLKRISSYGNRGKELYCIQDASAAVEHILLLAVDYGLDTCWVGAFNENEVSKILELPSYTKPVAIIPIGYSDEKIKSKSRTNIDEFIHFNRW
jgi:hypothetical protein